MDKGIWDKQHIMIWSGPCMHPGIRRHKYNNNVKLTVFRAKASIRVTRSTAINWANKGKEGSLDGYERQGWMASYA